MGDGADCRIYIGNLPPDVREKEIEDLFDKYGKIRGITLKNRNGPPFAFVEFDDSRDADDAVSGRNGYNFDGYRLRVEHPKGNSGFSSRSYDSYSSSRSRMFGRSGGSGPSQRSKYRVFVTGLPRTGSWQDLKDHMREAGDVSYADVYKDGSGIVDYANKDDMKFAVRHLDDTKFKSHEGETTYIRVKLDGSSPVRQRSYSPRRSPSYSPRRSRSPKYSPERRGRSRTKSPY